MNTRRMTNFLTEDPKEDVHADSYEDFVDWYQKSVAMPRGSMRPRFYLNLFSKPAEEVKAENLFEDELRTPSPANSHNLFDEEQGTPLALLVEKVTQPLSPMEAISIDLVTPLPSPKKWLNKDRDSLKFARENVRKKVTQSFTSLNLMLNGELARSKKYYKLWVQERNRREKAEARLRELLNNK